MKKILNLIEEHRAILKLIIEIVIFLILIILFTININVIETAPDSILYIKLSKLLNEGLPYEDVIRNKQILPPIGHPILLLLLGKLINSIKTLSYGILLFVFSLVYYTGRKLTSSILFALLISVIFYYFISSFTFSYGCVELSILFTNTLFIASYLLLINNNYKSYLFLFLTGVFFTLSILVRPTLLLPLFIMPVFIIWLYVIKSKSFRVHLFIYIIAITLFLTVFAISRYKYNDNRLITSTYSSYAIFSAFNKYIKLDEIYYYRRWKEIKSIKEKQEAKKILNYQVKWQERSAIQMREVKKFIKENPQKALSGFIWRLKKYSINGEKRYGFLFYLFILSSIIIILFHKIPIGKKKIVFLFLLLYLYIIISQSFFVYAGYRYYIIATLYMFTGFSYNLYYILKMLKFLYCKKEKLL